MVTAGLVWWDAIRCDAADAPGRGISDIDRGELLASDGLTTTRNQAWGINHQLKRSILDFMLTLSLIVLL